jgi:phage-related protein
MGIVVFSDARDFLEDLDSRTYGSCSRAIDLLKKYGNTLEMPYAKPVGKGVFELRVHSAAAIRMLYGFCDDSIVIVLAFKKERTAIGSRQMNLARRLISEYCS